MKKTLIIIGIITAVISSCQKDDVFALWRDKSKEIIKGDIKTRFEAYKTALESNLMQIDEVRYLENLEPLGLNFIKLGLQDVLFNPVTKEVYTPNTNQVTNIETGGDNIADRNQE